MLVGDYCISDWSVPEEKKPIGKCGRMHREFLKENNPFLLQQLVLDGKFWTYLADIEEQAQTRRKCFTGVDLSVIIIFGKWVKN